MRESKGLNTAAAEVVRRLALAGIGVALVVTAGVAVRAASPEAPMRVAVPIADGGELPRAGSAAHACAASGSSFAHDDGFQLQRRLRDGVSLCARVRGPVRFEPGSGAIRELPAGASVLVETRTAGGAAQRMLVSSEGGGRSHQWWVNGASLPADAAARAWLDDALAIVAADREVGRIHGEVGRLQGEIGRIQGEIGALQGRIGTIQGEIGTLQGRIGAIQGERGRLQGEIGSHQGAIGGLEGSRYAASDARARQIDQEIAKHEAAIRELQQQLDASGLRDRLDAAEAELRSFERSSSGRIDALEQEIDAIRRADRIGQIEKQIEELHADDRIDEITRRVAPTVERLAARVRAFAS